jgi:hypothetical protein
MSFVTQEDVFQTMEPVIRDTFKDFADGKPVTDVFPRIPYFESMLKYGSDKPDLRNPLVIADVSEVFTREDVTFNAFKNVIKSGGVVRAIPATGAASQSRSFFDKLNDWARTEGAPGLGYIVFEEEGGQILGKGPIAKFIPEAAQAVIREKAGIKAGDAVFFSAGAEDKAASLAGKARTRIGEELGLIDKDRFEFCCSSTRTGSSSAGSSTSRNTSGTRTRRRSTSRTTRSPWPTWTTTPSWRSTRRTRTRSSRSRPSSTTWSALATRWPRARSATTVPTGW